MLPKVCLWLNFIPFRSVSVTWRHTSYLKAQEKSEAAHQLCLHKNFSSVWAVWNVQLWAWISSAHTAISALTSSVPGCCPALRVTEWESVDKESDAKNPEVKFFPCFFFSPPSQYERGYFLSRYAMLKVGQFYLWLCNGMKEQLCSPLQGGSVYPHYRVNAPLASCCYGARG